MTRSRRADAGFTLVELLMTVTILSVSVLAIVGGLGAAAKGSDLQRRRGEVDAVLRTAAERLRDPSSPPPVPYVECAPAGAYEVAGPDGFIVDAAVVGYWDAEANRFDATCPEVDAGLQLIEVRVTTADSTITEAVELVRRR